MDPVRSAVMLPDSRLRDRLRGIVRGLLPGFGMINWVPVFCANCGKPQGYVPEENMTFAFWLCDPCAEKHGHIDGVTMIPDEVFWQKVREEQLERYGRLLTPPELQAAAESTTALGKLLREAPK